MTKGSEERDSALARIAVARAATQRAMEAMDAMVGFFIVPEEDQQMEARRELCEAIEDSLDEASVAAIAAAKFLEDVDPTEGEPDFSFLLEDSGESEDDSEAE